MAHTLAQHSACYSSLAGHVQFPRACHSAVVRPSGLHRQRVVITRATDASKLLRKPELKRPERPEMPKKLFNDQQQQQPADAASGASPASAEQTAASGVTVEYQRARAKEMLKYFQDKKLEETVSQTRLFGWTPKNEISNGRWVMFGVFVGLLTEYATGVDFPHQLGLMLSYLGIVDLE